jgi:hypothetical protein
MDGIRESRINSNRNTENLDMAKVHWIGSLGLLFLGGALGGLSVLTLEHPTASAQGNPNPASLTADVARLKDITPPNSHPMVDVGMFAANTWFAGQKKNWPLASYYLNEMRNRMRWEVHLNPGPKGADGNPVDMQSIEMGIENGSWTTVMHAIDMKNSQQFTAEYKHLLEDCYSCHKTAGRPYLRPMVPVSGAQPIVNLDPTATWPQ